MKFIITENQYADLRKSIIRVFLRRVGNRIDEIMENSVTDTLNWYNRRPGDLHEIGHSAFTDIIIDDVWQYVYESYIEPDVEFGDEDQDLTDSSSEKESDIFGLGLDDDSTQYKSKTGSQILGEFTSMFKGF